MLTVRVPSLVSFLFLLTCAEATAQQTSQPPYAGTGRTATRVAESCSTENAFCLSYCQSTIGVENCVQTCQQSRAMCMQYGVYAWKMSMRPTKTGLSRQ